MITSLSFPKRPEFFLSSTPLQLLWLLLLLPVLGYTQAATDRSTRLFALPIVYYTPETTWSFGGAGVMTFALDSVGPMSQLQLGGAYTLQDQLLVYLPFQLYFQADQLRLTGEVGYYRYNYFFYGIGNTFTDYEGELYGVDFPRVRLNSLVRLGEHQLGGLRYHLDDWEVYDLEPEGLLAQEEIAGRAGSTLSALGPVWQYDSRDHVFFPTEGWWAEASLLYNAAWLGGRNQLTKWTVDVRKYWSWREGEHVLAGQAYLEGTAGAPTFNQLALLGGTRLLRGYYEGRYRDRHLLATQAEYRFPIWKRLAGVTFASLGTVTHQWSEWQPSYLRYTAGAGLRFMLLPEDKIRLRLDYGFGQGTSAFYLTVGEAF